MIEKDQDYCDIPFNNFNTAYSCQVYEMEYSVIFNSELQRFECKECGWNSDE